MIVKLMNKSVILFAMMACSLSALAQSKSPIPTLPVFRKDTIRVTQTGAKGDGYALNTVSIQKAIDQQSSQGGGVVLVTPGLFVTGPIVLKTGVNLHIQSGATLLFSSDKSLYPLVEANWEGLPQMRNQSPISATGASRIAITGAGVIDGNGDAWRMVKKDKLTESNWKKLVASGGILSEDKKTWYPSTTALKGSQMQNPGVISPDKDAAFYESIKDFLRPNMVLLTSCKDVWLQGVTFQNSPAWCLHPLMCENLTVQQINVKNPWYAQNGDGIDVESCKNVLIEHSVFDVGDDALCMKSGRDAAGRQRAKPTENVLIRNCLVYAAHGGFVIGSEMSGGVRNIEVSQCTFIGTDIGLRFKSTRGRGGVVENIYIHDIYMKDIPGEAILFDLYYAAKDPLPLAGEVRELPAVVQMPVDETTPIFRNFVIRDVYTNGAAKAIFIRGLPEMPVQNISLENMVFQSKKGVDLQEAQQVRLKNVKLYTKGTQPIIDITQSNQISLVGMEVNNPAAIKLRLNGDRCKAIMLSKSNINPANEAAFELGANSQSLQVQQ
jgi:polygalacturonase